MTKLTDIYFLIKIEPEVRVISAKSGCQLIPILYNLHSKRIQDRHIRRGIPHLDFGLHRALSWIFTQADVKIQTLGAYFLTSFDISVNMLNQTLTGNVTRLAIQGSQSL